MTQVSRGKSEATLIAQLADNVPEMDKRKVERMPSIAKAWEYLDQKYANAQVITKKVVAELWDLKSLSGLNDVQKVMDLDDRISELAMTLKATDNPRAIKQLEDNKALIGHCIELLPDKYKTRFNEKLEDKMESMNPDHFWEPKDTYEYLVKYLEGRVKYFLQYEIEAMDKRSFAPQEKNRMKVRQVKASRAGGAQDGGAPAGGAGRDNEQRIQEIWDRLGPCLGVSDWTQGRHSDH